MKDGEIQQFGTPTDIYDEPVNRFVADFIGESNIVDGTMVKDFVVNIYGQDFECVDARIPSGKIEVVIRPEDISLVESTQGLFTATVDSMLFRGVHYEICCIDEKGYEWVIQSTKKTTIGSQVGLFLNLKLFILWFLEKLKKNLINVLKVTRILNMRNLNKFHHSIFIMDDYFIIILCYYLYIFIYRYKWSL